MFVDITCPNCESSVSENPCKCGTTARVASVAIDTCEKLFDDIQNISLRIFNTLASEGAVDLALTVDNLLASVDMQHLESRGWKIKDCVAHFLKELLRGESQIQINTSDRDPDTRG